MKTGKQAFKDKGEGMTWERALQDLFVALLKVGGDTGVADTPRRLCGMVPKVGNANEQYGLRAIVVVRLLLFLVNKLKIFWIIHPKNNGFSVMRNLLDVFVQHLTLHSLLMNKSAGAEKN